jgi:hypothetical protein
LAMVAFALSASSMILMTFCPFSLGVPAAAAASALVPG